MAFGGTLLSLDPVVGLRPGPCSHRAPELCYRIEQRFPLVRLDHDAFLPASGSATVTGAASRSNTPNEYKVSRFSRITVWLSIGASSRSCLNFPKPPSFTNRAKYVSDSARAKVIDRHPHGFAVVRGRRQPAHRDENCRGHRNRPGSHGVVALYFRARLTWRSHAFPGGTSPSHHTFKP